MRKSPSLSGSLCLLVTFTLAGCGVNEVNEDPLVDTSESASEGWTILIYGHADHNLSMTLLRDIQEMQRASLGPDIDILVMADFDGSQSAFEPGITWFRITGGGGEPEVIATSPEQDLDDPMVLREAIEHAFRGTSARHRGLILWDHGGGWEHGYGGDTSDGTRQGKPLSISQVSDAIASGLAAAGIDDEPPLSFLAFDTCLMAGPEVFTELYGLTQIYFASAEIEYGGGWDYERTLTWISENPDAAPQELAAAEVRYWDAHHADSGVDDDLLRAHVALDMDRSDHFIAAMAELVSRWQASRDLTDVDLGRAAFDTLPGYSNGIADLLGEPDLRDLGQFLDLLSVVTSDTAMADAANEAYDALDDMIIDSSLGELRILTGQRAMNIELPAAVRVGDHLGAYRSGAAAWNEATDWDAALRDLAARADRNPPMVDTWYSDGGNALEFVVEDADAAMATAQLAYVDAMTDNVYELGVVGIGRVVPGERYEVDWNGDVTLVGGAEVCVRPWITPGTDIDGELLPSIFSVPGLFGDGEVEYEGALLFAEDDRAVVNAVVWEGDLPALLTLTELAGTTFTPLIPGFNLTTDEAFAEPGATLLVPESGSLPIDSAPSGDGEYYLLVVAFDVWGNVETNGELFAVGP